MAGILMFWTGLGQPGVDQNLLAGGFAALGIALVVGDWLKETIDDRWELATALSACEHVHTRCEDDDDADDDRDDD
ncbi:hypothetical protein EG835_07580 [bacterium]|nr:hypothetical protein [bacterium]